MAYPTASFSPRAAILAALVLHLLLYGPSPPLAAAQAPAPAVTSAATAAAAEAAAVEFLQHQQHPHDPHGSAGDELLSAPLTLNATSANLTFGTAGEKASTGMLALVPRWAMRPTLRTRPKWRDAQLNQSAVKWYSQSGEDRHLFNTYFHNIHHGVYLEMGALNGEFFSNTKFFYETMGWRGLLIEPSPISFAQLLNIRPKDLCVRAAVCNSHGTVHYMTHSHISGAVDGILEFMAPSFLAQWHSNLEKKRAAGAIIAMPCMPLQALFDLYQIRAIDFWSLDVEGAELEVLKTVNFTAVHISVILIESDGSSKEKEAAIRTLLLANNFVTHGMLMRSEWFVNRHFRPHASNGTAHTSSSSHPHLHATSGGAPNGSVGARTLRH